jgi:hypothetical protein
MEGSLSMALNEYAAVTAQGIIPMLFINVGRAAIDQGTFMKRAQNIFTRTAFWPYEIGKQQFYLARNLLSPMGRANLRVRFNELIYTNRFNLARHAARGTTGNIESTRRLRTFIELHVELSRTVDTFGSSRAGRLTSWNTSTVNAQQRAKLLQLLSDLNPTQQVGDLQSNLTTYADLRRLRDEITEPEFRRLQREGLFNTELNPRLFGDSASPRPTNTTPRNEIYSGNTYDENFETTNRNRASGIDDSLITRNSYEDIPETTRTPQTTSVTPPRSRARRMAGRGGAILGMLGLGAAAYKIGDHYQRDTATRYDYNSPSIQVASEQETQDEVIEEDPRTINQILEAENSRILQEYNQIIEHFSFSNLENIQNKSETELNQILTQMQQTHLLQTEKLNEFVSNNKEALKNLLSSNNIDVIALGEIEAEDFIYTNSTGQNFTLAKIKIEPDTDRLFLEHISSDEFNRLFWDTVNMAKGSIGEQAIETVFDTQSTTTTQITGNIATVGAYMTPFVGTGLDIRDAYREARRGNYGEAAISTTFAVFGGITDGLLAASFLATPVTGGVSAAGGVAVTSGARGILATARASRAARLLRANRSTIVATSSATGLTSMTTSTALGVLGKRPYTYESRTYFD